MRRKVNRIRILDGAVATATLGLPKTNGVIIARSGKYHRWLAHSTIRLFFFFFFFLFQPTFIYQQKSKQNVIGLNKIYRI